MKEEGGLSMPRQGTVVDVQLASPSDVNPERELVRTVVTELNETWKARGIQFVLWASETMLPGTGEYPQAVINRQFPPTVDAFVAIFWTRVGSATPVAESGTVEELNIALAQKEADPTSITVSVYFKTAEVNHLSCDLDQLQAIRDLRARFGSDGQLWKEFVDGTQLERLLRRDLERHAHAAIDEGSAAGATIVEESTTSVDEEAEGGLLDVLADFHRATTSIGTVMVRLTEGMATLGSDMQHGSARLEAIDWKNDADGLDRAHQIARRLAGDMDVFSEVLHASVPVLDESLRAMVTNLDLAMGLAPKFGRDAVAEMVGNRPGLLELRSVLGGSAEQMSSFVSTLEALPPVSREFGRARSRLLEELKQLKYRLDSAHTDIGRSLKNLDALAD